jgi:choline kinase
VLAAEPHVTQAFFLAMCDHIFEPAALHRLLAADDGRRPCALVVDRHLTTVLDIDEATKVQLDGDSVTAIGKQLTAYDAVDTGVFLCRSALFEALRLAARLGRHTLSDAVQLLAWRGQMHAVDGSGLDWFDIDTVEDLRFAEETLGAAETLLTPGYTAPVPPVPTAMGGADVI